jgi:hypothetical protein
MCALLMLVSLGAVAQAYKCKHPDGKTSFQDQPCEPGSKGTEIVVKDPSPPSGDPRPPKAKAPGTTPGKTLDTQKPVADEALVERNRQLEAQNRALRCSSARRSLAALQAQRPVFHYDKDGNRQYVEDSNRQSEIATVQRSVAENCN